MSYELIEKAINRLKSETGAPAINRAAPVRFVLAFPNVYSVGMSSLGFQLIYGMLNSISDASCERVFLPEPDDINEYVRTRTELFALESQTPLSEFDVIAFSISFELDYLNVLQMLKLSGIPITRKDRDESRPLVIAGGPCATFNPEPLSDFIDAFVVGEAEEILPGLVQTIKANQETSRKEMLNSLAQLPGIYVPSLYNPEYDKSGRLAGFRNIPPAPSVVRRRVVQNLNEYPFSSLISTPEAEFGEINLIEMSRGCGRHCRFCAAGYITRPPRPRDISITQITTAETNPRRYGLVGAAVFDHPNACDICKEIIESGGEFTVSSIRLETLTPEVAELLAAGGQRTLTIAPEAGSARLRKIINKNASDEQIFSAVSAALGAGIKRVKLYFMIGLPTETDSDINDIVELIRKLSSQYPQVNFHVSVSSFVPKPWTPFQWHPMERESILKRRFNYLQKSIRGIKGAEFGGESPRLAVIQGILARGDRKLGRALAAALYNGGDYPAAFRQNDIDLREYLYRQRGKDEIFPWDHIETGVNKSYLWQEYQKALKGEATNPCSVEKCRACGACK